MKKKLGPVFNFKLGPVFNFKTPKSWTSGLQFVRRCLIVSAPSREFSSHFRKEAAIFCLFPLFASFLWKATFDAHFPHSIIFAEILWSRCRCGGKRLFLQALLENCIFWLACICPKKKFSLRETGGAHLARIENRARTAGKWSFMPFLSPFGPHHCDFREGGRSIRDLGGSSIWEPKKWRNREQFSGPPIDQWFGSPNPSPKHPTEKLQ